MLADLSRAGRLRGVLVGAPARQDGWGLQLASILSPEFADKC